VKILGEEIPVQASIHTINGFSAHADQRELIEWHKRTGNPKRTFLVRGEQEVMKRFATLLTNTSVDMPALNDSFEI
jgi:metallo-beta-lactamase family protein